MTKKKEDGENKGHKKDDYKKLYEELKAENARLNESLLRERADVENIRKRADDEKNKLGSFYKALVIKELLSTVDNFDRALNSIHKTKDAQKKDYEDLVKGFRAIYKQFEEALAKLGVEKIKTVGEHFDPELHEAVTMEEGDGKNEIVSEELQAGYKIGDEILRHAMVRVKS